MPKRLMLKRTKDLKGKIIESGYTCKLFAVEIGISAAHITSIIKRKIKASHTVCEVICEKLDIDINEWFY